MVLAGLDPFAMSARRFLNVMHTWLLDAHGPEKVEEYLHGKKRWRDTLPAEQVEWAVSDG